MIGIIMVLPAMVALIGILTLIVKTNPKQEVETPATEVSQEQHWYEQYQSMKQQ